jgi:hypothetical protein
MALKKEMHVERGNGISGFILFKNPLTLEYSNTRTECTVVI